MEKELTPKQQISEALRNAETVLVVTGQRPSVDQVTAAMAFTAMLRKFGKKVTAIISDPMPASTGFLDSSMIERDLGGLRDFIVRLDLSKSEVDSLKYTIENGKLNVYITPYQGGFSQRDVSFDYGDYHFDAVVALGVASYSRLDRVYAANQETLRNIPLLNIDFHRSNENYGAVNHIDTNAASLGEMLIALSESLQTGLIDDSIATALLTGIMAATDRFTNTDTTPKTLTVAAQMMAMGANQALVVRNLYRQPKEDRPARQPQVSQQQPTPKPKPPMPVVEASAPQEELELPAHATEAPQPDVVAVVPETAQPKLPTEHVESEPAPAVATNPANRPNFLQTR